ncbi:MAG TPA: hypothetical protein VKX28_05265 [Xanthobacteraceae bacterium]|nr:hypothetical protein [Xanthobacteraceae bacterium]
MLVKRRTRYSVPRIGPGGTADKRVAALVRDPVARPVPKNLIGAKRGCSNGAVAQSRNRSVKPARPIYDRRKFYLIIIAGDLDGSAIRDTTKDNEWEELE